MRLGLIGTGKQGQRYLLEKNGGRHITVSGARRIPLDDVDGVIIATHPAGHKELALECIAAGKSVLVEKPLALNLKDCMDIIDAAEKAGVTLLVAHLDCWAGSWLTSDDRNDHYCVIRYEKHERDYSPWLDWAPHALALLEKTQSHCSAKSVSLAKDDHSYLGLFTKEGTEIYVRRNYDHGATPMWLMIRDFLYGRCDYSSTRRVYRALFAEE